MITIGLVSAAMIRAHGWSERFPPHVVVLADGVRDISPERGRCHNSDESNDRPACVLGAVGVRPTALLWGDSHGVEMAFALGEELARRNLSLVQRTHSACPPFIDYRPERDPSCTMADRRALAQIHGDPMLHTIYLAGFWAKAPSPPLLIQQLDRTIAALVSDGRRVILIGPVPSTGFETPRKLAHLALQGRLAEAAGADLSDIAPLDALMRALANDRGVTYVSPIETLCASAKHCAIEKGGRSLYFDSHHLSMTGARFVLRNAPMPDQPRSTSFGARPNAAASVLWRRSTASP